MKKCPKLSSAQIAELKKFRNKSKKKIEASRATAILLLNRETDYETITEATDYSKRRAFSLRKVYFEKGITALKSPDIGRNKVLTPKELEEISNILKRKSPKDFGYESTYWNTGLLGEFIFEKYKKRYKSRTSYYLIFKRSKLSFHKPGKVYVKHDPEAVEKWRLENKRILEKAWNDPDTVILTADEMLIRQSTTVQKVWLPVGNYPQVFETNSSRHNRSIYGFLNLKTGKEHAYSSERQNMYVTRRFLYKIRKVYRDKKILLLWDNPGWHKGSVVRNYLNKQNICVISYPPYAPELNPQEHVWKAGREHITHNRFIEDIKKITAEFVKYLNSNKFKYSLLGLVAK